MRDDLEQRQELLHELKNKLTPLAARLRLAEHIHDDPARREVYFRAALRDLDILTEWMTTRSQELAREACRRRDEESVERLLREVSSSAGDGQ